MAGASKFKASQFDVKAEPGAVSESRVVKISADDKVDVKSFEFSKLGGAGQLSYRDVKAKFGPLATTDPDRKSKTRKDSRFSLNPLLKGPLSVEDEERKAIDARVRETVLALEQEARKKAEEVGYQVGLKKGYDDAFAKFREEGAERIKRLEKLIGALEGAKGEIFRENEKFLIEMVYRIARTVLLRELETDREYVLRLSRELLERVGVRENITVRINPKDQESLKLLTEGLVKSLGELKNLNVEVSDQVGAGGCAIETEWNAIDASVETQLKGIYTALGGEAGPMAPDKPPEGAGR